MSQARSQQPRGARLRGPSPTAWGPGGGKRLRTATAAVLAAVALAACAPKPPPSPDAGARLQGHLETGLALSGARQGGACPVDVTQFPIGQSQWLIEAGRTRIELQGPFERRHG